MIATMYEKDNDYGVNGKKYKAFIHDCFKYAEYFSLLDSLCLIKKDVDKYKWIKEKLKPFLLFEKATFRYPEYDSDYILPTPPFNKPFTMNVYECTPEAEKVFLTCCDDLFLWYMGRPENLCFYYENKKPMLTTVTHEFECCMSCTPELFEKFKKYSCWMILDKDGFYEEVYW